MGRRLIKFVVAAWVLSAVSVGAVVERRIERSFEVPGDAMLKVDTFDGAVRVTSDANARTIDVVLIQTADVATEDEMDARLAAVDIRMGQRNGVVRLTARCPEAIAWSWKSWPPVDLVYEIRVPRRCDIEVITRNGRIVLGSHEGRVVLANESGGIFTGEIDGSVDVRSQIGTIAVTSATGTIHASTLIGSIAIGRAGGPVVASSRGGFIEIQRASGKVKVRGDGSDAKIGFVTPLVHGADIALSGGDLALVLERDNACALDVRSSVFGQVAVRGGLPLDIVKGGDGLTRMKAKLNGGGPRIAARVSGGNVVVRGVDPLSEPGAKSAGNLSQH